MIEAELYDGTVLEFPEGTAPEVIQRVVKQQTAARQGQQPAAAPSRGHNNVPEYVPPGVEGYDPKTGEVAPQSGGWTDTIGAVIAGANDMPIIGPATKRIASAGAAALHAPFSDQTFGQLYDQNMADQERLIRENPGAALAGNIGGTVAMLGPVGATKRGADLLGLSGSIGNRVLKSGMSGGAISGGDTAIRGGDLGEIAASTGIGAGLGMAIPGAGELAKAVYRGGKNLTTGIWRGIFDPTEEATKRVSGTLRADQAANPGAMLTPDDLTSAQRFGQPVINADRGGEATRALARTSANFSPEARDAMQRHVGDRFASQGNRVARMIGAITGGRTDDLLAVEGIKSAATTANKAAYDGAFARPAAQALWNEGYAQLMQAPAVQRAVRLATVRGGNRAAAQGFKPITNPFVRTENGFTLARNADGSTALPTLQFWDQVKRNLDDDIGQLSRAGKNSEASDLRNLKNTLVRMLDQSVPEYRAARQGAAAFFGAEDAVEAGKAFAKSNRMLPEYQRGLKAMNSAEREAFEIGFASEMIDAAKNTRDRANVVQNMFGSAEAREKMVMAFGPQRAREIEAFVRVENAMDMMRGAFGNSTTARQLIEAGAIGGGTWVWTGDWQKGVAAGALTAGVRAGSKKINERVLRETARLLLSDDPKLIEKAVRNASVSPQHMAALDALTKQTGLLARSANMNLAGPR